MRYQFIHEQTSQNPVIFLCWTLQVTRSSYYAFVTLPTESARAQEDRRLFAKILTNHAATTAWPELCAWRA